MFVILRSEAEPYQNAEVAVTEVVNCLKALEKFCPSKEDYNELCLLLTLPSIQQHSELKDWNPSNSRIKCFNSVLPFIEKYLPYEKKANENVKEAKGDRLLKLIIKGILYESCVEFCQKKATLDSHHGDEKMEFVNLLDGTEFNNADLSLISWLQSIPSDSFLYPFEQKTLNVDVEQIEKPSLVASWSEVILVTPIKPKIFPHSATPFTRIKTTDLMSKSFTLGMVDAISKGVLALSANDVTDMSRSSIIATGFHLQSSPTQKQSNKSTTQSNVDKLFESDNVFNSSCNEMLPKVNEKSFPIDNSASSSLTNHHLNASNQFSNNSSNTSLTNFESSDLWKKFQKQKNNILDKVAEDDVIRKNADANNVKAQIKHMASTPVQSKFKNQLSDGAESDIKSTINQSINQSTPKYEDRKMSKELFFTDSPVTPINVVKDKSFNQSNQDDQLEVRYFLLLLSYSPYSPKVKAIASQINNLLIKIAIFTSTSHFLKDIPFLVNLLKLPKLTFTYAFFYFLHFYTLWLININFILINLFLVFKHLN